MVISDPMISDDKRIKVLFFAPPMIGSAHPEMAIFHNLCVRFGFQSSKYFNVFLWLKSLSSLTLQKLSHFWMDTRWRCRTVSHGAS